MDANQPLHFAIEVYNDGPPPAAPKQITLCPGARHLSRPALVIDARLVNCRRCRELLDLLDVQRPR